MNSIEAIEAAIKEFQKDFDDGEETNQWLTDVIVGLQQALNDLEVLNAFKNALVVEPIPPVYNKEFSVGDYTTYLVKYSQYIFDKEIREKLTQWIIHNIDKETVRKWLENE